MNSLGEAAELLLWMQSSEKSEITGLSGAVVFCQLNEQKNEDYSTFSFNKLCNVTSSFINDLLPYRCNNFCINVLKDLDSRYLICSFSQ